MTELDKNDLTFRHWKLVDGRGLIQLIHRPSGLAVDSFCDSRPVSEIVNGLLKELENKVVGQQSDQRKE